MQNELLNVTQMRRGACTGIVQHALQVVDGGRGVKEPLSAGEATAQNAGRLTSPDACEI